MRRAAVVLAMLALTGCGAGQAPAAVPPIPTPVPTVAAPTPAPTAPASTATADPTVAAIDALTQQTAAACGETEGQIGQSVVIIRDQLASKGVVYGDGAPFRAFAAATLASVVRLHLGAGVTCPQAFVAVMDQTLQAAGAQ